MSMNATEVGAKGLAAVTHERDRRKRTISTVLGVLSALSLGFAVVYAVAEGYRADETGTEANPFPMVIGGVGAIVLFTAAAWYRAKTASRR